MTSFISKHQNIPVERKIVGFSGSPRKKGNSDILLQTILAGASQSGAPCKSLNLSTIAFQGCIGCEKCRRDKICTGLTDGMSVLYSEIVSSQGIVLVSPAHNYNVTSWMKAFMDRLYCFFNFENNRPRSWSSRFAGQGRKAVVAAVCEQADEEDMGFTIEAMKKPLEALDYEIVAALPVFGIFDKGLVQKDQEILEEAHSLGIKLADSIATPGE